MSVKTDAVAIVVTTKDAQVAAVTSVFSTMIDSINALPEDTDVAALQTQVSDLSAQVADLTSKLGAVQSAFDAEDAELKGEKDKEATLETKNAKLQKKLDAILAALQTEE